MLGLKLNHVSKRGHKRSLVQENFLEKHVTYIQNSMLRSFFLSAKPRANNWSNRCDSKTFICGFRCAQRSMKGPKGSKSCRGCIPETIDQVFVIKKPHESTLATDVHRLGHLPSDHNKGLRRPKRPKQGTEKGRFSWFKNHVEAF